jgi:murein DD-endopeptidase MepM/ murein hydrolase activator NlpD
LNHRDDELRLSRGPALLALAGLTAVVGIATFGAIGMWRGATRGVTREEVASALEAARPPAVVKVVPAPPRRAFEVVTARLGKNQTLAQALYALSLSTAEVNQVVGALTSIFVFNHARAGDQLRLERRLPADDGTIQSFSYRQGIADEWLVSRLDDGTLYGEKRPVELVTGAARVAVTIESSLYESLQKQGEDPGLAVLAADVLAWDVDFYQDVRAGDGMKILVEKTYADGKLLHYGEVLAVEYAGESVGEKRLFRYTDPKGDTSYYDENGNSARRGFLKSPLKYANITSRYGMRFHPVLQYQKQHQGIDYGAPTGTPVWAVGDGQVLAAGANGGCGTSVTLKHRNGLVTVYCHLSGIAAGIHAGARAGQKQVIGYVGQTGLATGPHLHYAVKRGGDYMNPLALKLPRDAPVAAQFKADFLAKIAPLRTALDARGVASAR